MTDGYRIKDSGERQEFDGGAMRDTEEGKLDYSNLFVWFEPMGTRYVQHMTKGREKYPDPEPGVPNWSLFEATPENLHRTLRSFDRHVKAYRMGETDEDHAAAILFNLNLAERIRAALEAQPTDYTETAEAMLDDPTFDEPVEVNAGSTYRPGDKVRLKDRKLYSRSDDPPMRYDDYFPEVVTLQEVSQLGTEPAWYVEEDGCFILEEQIDDLVEYVYGYTYGTLDTEEATIT